MNDNQNLTDESHDDDSLERSLLAPLESDTVPPDKLAMERAISVASDIYQEQSAIQGVLEQPRQLEPNSEDNSRRGGMIAKALVGLSAIAAAVMMFFQAGAPDETLTLGSILDKTIEAKSLKLVVDRDGKKSDVLVSLASHVRWDESKTKYRIASNKEAWEIDAERGELQPAEITWHDQETGKVDLLALLGVKPKQSKMWKDLVASEHETVGGKQRYVFTSTAGKPVLHAYFAGVSNDLLEVHCWPNGWNANVAPAKLLVVARDIIVDESTFVVARQLADDGRIGKITDSQGIVTLRGKMSKRWTPVVRHMLLKPGDWVRTDSRGANATTLVTASAYKVIVGPSSLVETIAGNEIRLHRGEINVVGSKSAKEELKIVSPGDTSVSVGKGSSSHFRVGDQRELQVVKRKPLWLAGYQGKSNVDTTGSLLANIDGRETPLTIGYHKVRVEIRDQIARTTIEESFVNHTGRRLEGIFHFPLPQDASISGFGMWIGDELVEADVVEKQRAREIFETILREKRDPGLLEWTGGNIFKARVFPIEPSGEKRIKIVYTQVLPRTGNKFRYSYGLRSEMLQTKPLRELEIDVQVHSATPIQSIGSSTHVVRTLQTDHSAKLEFEAQEYTPQRDFEIVCELDHADKNVVVVPHQRGKDGYFLAQFALPDQGGWKRETVKDGEPLDLLIVCDTSASMDSAKRADQQRFVRSLLSGLGEGDRFDIAYCDVDCGWQNNELVPASTDNVDLANDWLEGRISLGWTNLDEMLASVLSRTKKSTNVVYVGDGIVSTVESNPQAFVNRLQRAARKAKGNFHAVSVGNSFETVVLNGLGAVGAGSVRGISGAQTPQKVALELLTEISDSRLTNLKFEFRGIDVAAVYPERLPNLSSGTQQILIGRYLPKSGDQTGELVVTGKRNGKSVKYSTPISLANAQSGNSFIPRLWARGHLDHLLSQGSGPLVRDQVIALSEEFHIMTPYTSLLVLESDTDRERFGVKRRMEIRDGEQFFADGRKKSNYELLQKQIKAAGDWRMALRRSVLVEMSQLGRDSGLFAEIADVAFAGTTFSGGYGGWMSGGGAFASGGSPISGPVGRLMASNGNEIYDFSGVYSDRISFDSSGELEDRENADPHDMDVSEPFGSPDFSSSSRIVVLTDGAEIGRREQSQSQFLPKDNISQSRRSADKQVFKRLGVNSNRPRSDSMGYASVSGVIMWNGNPPSLSLDHLFASNNRSISSTPKGKVKGDARAVEWLESLAQPARFENGGIECVRLVRSYDLAWDRVTEKTTKNLIAKSRWAHENAVEKHWFDMTTRSAHHKAFETIWKRSCSLKDSASVMDLERPFATVQQLATFYNREATIVKENDDVVIIRLAYANNSRVQTRIAIDRKRNVVTSVANFNEWTEEGDLPQSTDLYSQHKRLAGVWWPTKIERKNRDGKTTRVVTQDLKSLSKAAMEKAFRDFVPNSSDCLVLSEPLPSVRDSHIAILQDKAKLEHHYALLHDDCDVQDWDRAANHVAAMEKLAKGRSAINWIRLEFLKRSVQHEEASDLIDRIAETLNQPNDQCLFLANHLAGQVSGVLDYNETLRLLDRLKPIYEREDSASAWRRLRVQQLRNLGDPQTIELQKRIAVDEPWDHSMQTRYSQDLKDSGDLDEAIAWIQKQIDGYPGDRNAWIFQYYFDRIDKFLREAGRSGQLVEFCEKRLADNPGNRAAMDKYLNALMFDGRSDDSDKIAMQWMKAAQVDGELNKETETRLLAGVSFALGNRSPVHLNWMHPKWYKPLSDVARFFLDSEHHTNVSRHVVTHYRFKDSREADELFAEIAKRVRKNVDALSPKTLERFLPWIVQQKTVGEKQWRKTAVAIRIRWDSAKDLSERTSLGNALVAVLKEHFQETELYPFLRRRLERALGEGNVAAAATHRNAIYTHLLAEQAWTQEHENEAFAILNKLGDGQAIDDPIPSYATSLFQLVDRMFAKRVSTARKNLEATGNAQELTRQQFAAREMQWVKEARKGLIETLDQYAGGDDELSKWFLLEKIHQQVKVGENLDEVAQECWLMVGDAPTPLAPDHEIDKLDAAARGQLVSQELRKERAMDVLSYLAIRLKASKRLRKTLLNYLETGAKTQVDDPTPWRYRQFDLLIALDRPEELKAKLESWIAADPFPVVWQGLLANLHAEMGEVDSAIRLMETVRSFVRLTPQQSSSLSKWYLVSDQEAKYDAAKHATFSVTNANVIANWLNRQLNRLNDANESAPTEIEDNVLDAISALMMKSSNPESHIYLLMNFYKRTRDFRLLKMIPEACVGRSTQSVYPTLQSISFTVIPIILKEATLDKISERIDEMRAGNLSKLDERALDLLETTIQRRAAEVMNEPGPHIEKAKEAMKRAFARGDWMSGEIKQMAGFLASLNTLYMKELRQERARQYRELLDQTEAGTEVRFYVHWKYANSIAWSDGDHDKGITEMQVAIANYKRMHPTGFSQSANQAMFDYVRMLGYRGRFADAEKFLRQQIKTAINPAQRIAYLTQLNNTLIHALRDSGQVSLGTGEKLYQQLRRLMTKQATSAIEDEERTKAVQSVLQLFRVADEKNIKTADDDFWKFVSMDFASIAAKQSNNHQTLINTVLNRVEQQLGGFKALEFTLIVFETVPERWQYSWNNLWNRMGYKFAQRLHKHAKTLGDLEPRVLKVLLAELEFDLTTRQGRGRYGYSRNSGYFWEEKRDEFAAAAESVLDRYKESGRHVDYIGKYFYEHLHRHGRAIEIMLKAHASDLLTINGKSTLASYLINRERAKEAVPILEEVIAESPDYLHYRIQMLRAHAQAKQTKKWDATLKTTDEHFRQGALWSHATVGEIGRACLDAKRYELSVEYYKEAISAHKRNTPQRHNDRYTLSSYYQQLATAYSGLKDTAKAVDAISAAMIVWRTDKSQRRSLEYSLQRVLSECDDLTAYVKSVDRQVAKTGMDSPILRKELGDVFYTKRKLPEAISQLRAALDLQPNDPETHKKLIEVLEHSEDKKSAIDQSLALIDIEKHNLDNYRRLVDRLSDDPAMAERAITTIIEAAPNEAEHHQAVADLRHKNRDLQQAIGHWKRVAELRESEPTGLLGLAKVQIAAKNFSDAKSTLKRIEDTQWDQRFSNELSEARKLLSGIE